MSPRPAPWEAVVDAAVVTAATAEQALTSLEMGRRRYDDVHRRAAERLATLTPEMGRPDLAMRARLVLADIDMRHGGVVQAAKAIQDIQAEAEKIGEAYILARSHFLLTAVQHSLGDSPTARVNGIRSIEMLPDDAPTSILIDHLCTLAIAYGPGPDSARCHAEALDLVAVTGDVFRAIGIHNSLAYFAYETGDIAIATEHAQAMTELSEVRGIPLVATQLDTLARVRMMQGRHDDAIAILQPLLAHTETIAIGAPIEDLDPKPYGLPEGMLTLAEAHRALGRYSTAQVHLDTAMFLAQERGLGRVYARALEAQACLYADLGEFRRAYEQHQRFHEAISALHSDEKEARARMVQASFDAAAERRDAERFRELAMRDALTGLYNRRFVDGQLAALTQRSMTNRTPLSAAIADADFFKRINDRLSHEVGDHVLRTLASILAGSVVDPETVGRLGGEEFVILMPNTAATAAFDRCEEIRGAVADYPWESITGSIPVTVSIGVTTADDGHTSPTSLLSDADRNLYAAKRSGRNRVMADAR